MTVCPVKSPRYGKAVRKGHEDILCYGDSQKPEAEPEKPEPPTECTDASAWVPGTRLALSYVKQCA